VRAGLSGYWGAAGKPGEFGVVVEAVDSSDLFD
jgi:hypothetical protein